MTDEQVELLKVFHELFDDKPNARIVLYGLGINTAFLLPQIKEQTVIGLMDAENVGATFYGHKVLSSDEVIGKTDYIIIVARPTYQNMIYRRIKHLQQYGITICNLYKMPFADDAKKSDNPYWQKSVDELKNLLKGYDVISFDIFDTLLIRKVLLPYHVFDRVAQKISLEFHKNIPFRTIRQAAEQKAKLRGIPTLNEIYDELAVQNSWTQDFKNTIMNWEWQEELDCLLPRKVMRQVFEYAKSCGKIVIITSDMYLNQKQLTQILNRNGYSGWENLFVSCEYNKSKENGDLYDVVKTFYPDKKILHIGDNDKVDGENARLYGIDSYTIYSPYQALQASNLNNLADKVDNQQAAAELGIFLANSFSDPYILCKGKGSLTVPAEYDLGYNFFGPLILCFVQYLKQISVSYKNPFLLLSGRDGYAIKNVLDIARKIDEDIPSGYEYFLTSRRAICMPNFKTENDIWTTLKKFTGTVPLSTVMREQFSIHLGDEGNKKFSLPYEMDNLIDAVKPYVPKILERAKIERQNYLKYIQQNFNLDDAEVIVFDLMTNGTIPLGVQNLLDRRVDVLAFSANINDAAFKSDKIYSLLPYSENFSAKGAFLSFFHMWECVLTAPTGQLECFDEHGQPIFRDDTKPATLSSLQEVWRGIYGYIAENYEFLTKYQNQMAASMADNIFGELTRSGHLLLNERLKDIFIFQDNFRGGGKIALGI